MTIYYTEGGVDDDGTLPIHIGQFTLDIITLEAIRQAVGREIVYVLYGPDGDMAGFFLNRAQSDLAAMELTLAERVKADVGRLLKAVANAETTLLPPVKRD